MRNLALLGLILIAGTTFQSCKKNDTKDETCRPVTFVTYDSQTNQAIPGTFTYTGNTLTKIDVPNDRSVTFERSNDRISKRNTTYSGSTTVDEYEQFSYNSNGTISRIESYERISATGFQKYMNTDFTYTSGKLTNVLVSLLTGNNTFSPYEEHTYAYTGNNITGQVIRDYSSGQVVTYPLTLTYDTNENYIKKTDSDAIQQNPLFFGPNPIVFAFFYSQNNVKTINGLNVAYSLDSKNNITSVTIDGDKLIDYTYQCQ